jgi:DNA polymerase V
MMCGYEYRKAGVMLSGLVPVAQLTERLFNDETLERFRLVMPVVDMLNKKYGRDTVRWAATKVNITPHSRSVRPS